MSFTTNITICPNEQPSLPIPPATTYWEAWYLPPDNTKVVTTYGWTDQLGSFGWQSTSGMTHKEGVVKFFRRSDLNVPSYGVVPPGFSGPGQGKPQKCWNNSGGLPCSDSQPSWWNNNSTEGPAVHYVNAYWFCCLDTCVGSAVQEAYSQSEGFTGFGPAGPTQTTPPC